jgi:hypothetical protein
LAFSPEFSTARSSSCAFKDVLSAAARAAIPEYSGRAVLQIKEARLQSEQEVKEEEAVLTSYVLKLLGQFLVFFFQGEEAPTNL